jgi:pyruvate/2-oxoglutarate/acetoin dehydrogenase E1 component
VPKVSAFSSYEAATTEGIAEEMRRDPRVICIGNRPPESLSREFGDERIRLMPMSEAAMTGVAIGCAEVGLRPIVLLRKLAFTFVAFDQIANQAAKLRYMSGGQFDLPVVIYAPYGDDPGLAAQHCQSAYAIYAHIPGLKVVLPSDPRGAKALLKASVRDPNPVVFLHPDRPYPTDQEVGDVDSVAPLGVAEIRRAGSDVSIVALGYMVHLAEQVANRLADESISIEVVDPQTLSPLDARAIRASAAKTGRLVVVDEAPPACSMASEIAALVVEDRKTFQSLRAPVQRVCALPFPVPYSPPLENAVLPSVEQIEAAVRTVLE